MGKNGFSAEERAKRQKRWNHFNEYVLPFIAKDYDVSQPDPNSYKILNAPQGEIMVYPKGDKLLLIDEKKWISFQIVAWLRKNVIKQKI